MAQAENTPQPDNAAPVKSATERRAADRTVWGLAALFGAIYFIQGIAEPTEGLISQPVKSWMDDHGMDVEKIGEYQFWIGIPWMIKPVWGLLVDLVPLPFGRRRGWLLLASAMTMSSLLWLYFFPPRPGVVEDVIYWALIACIGVTITDVATDALMIEKGQPLGITGKLQSAQWTCMYAGSILASVLGGRFSDAKRLDWAFLVCAAFMWVKIMLATFAVREPTYVAPAERSRTAFWTMLRGAISPLVLCAAAYLFLWAFNPFSNAVLQLHMKNHLQFAETVYGDAQAVYGWGCMLASFAYGFYCRRVPFPRLMHGSIVAGVAATAAYWWLSNEVSAYAIAFFVGLTYQTGTMIQLDLAARVCPPAAAGTIFALLMSVSNAGLSMATLYGTRWYKQWSAAGDPATAFHWLVGIGTAATAASWLLVPLLNHYAVHRAPSATE